MNSVEAIKQDMDTLSSASRMVDSLKFLPRPLKQRILGFMGTGRRALLKEKSDYEAIVDLGPEFPETIEQYTQTTIEIPADGVSYHESDRIKFETSQRFGRG